MTDNIIWNQIENSFNEEVTIIRSHEINKFEIVISNIIASGILSIKDYFVSLYGDDYAKNEFYFDILKYQMLIVENDKLVKSKTCDSIISKIIEFYIEMLKWKLEFSVYNYLAGIELSEVEKVYFNKSPQGFTGEWKFVTKSGESGIYSTRTIIASGPIVRAHYRYISNVQGKVNLDATKRKQILNQLKLNKPKLVVQTKAEKELLLRINSSENKIKSYERTISDENNRIISYNDKLNDDNISSNTLEYLKSRIIDSNTHLKKYVQSLNQ